MIYPYLLRSGVLTQSRFIMSFLGIEGYHAFVTGARGGIGAAIVEELLGQSIEQRLIAKAYKMSYSCRV
jgi:hypothetical protein